VTEREAASKRREMKKAGEKAVGKKKREEHPDHERMREEEKAFCPLVGQEIMQWKPECVIIREKRREGGKTHSGEARA